MEKPTQRNIILMSKGHLNKTLRLKSKACAQISNQTNKQANDQTTEQPNNQNNYTT